MQGKLSYNGFNIWNQRRFEKILFLSSLTDWLIAKQIMVWDKSEKVHWVKKEDKCKRCEKCCWQNTQTMSKTLLPISGRNYQLVEGIFWENYYYHEAVKMVKENSFRTVG